MYVQATQPGPFGESIFVGRPDRFDGLPVVWIVLGRTPDDQLQCRIPVRRDEVFSLVTALLEVNRVEGS